MWWIIVASWCVVAVSVGLVVGRSIAHADEQERPCVSPDGLRRTRDERGGRRTGATSCDD